MNLECFFRLLLRELEIYPHLQNYYKFWNKPNLFEFRKAYFCQRLRYILEKIIELSQTSSNLPLKILDCGCGYGTTSLFLAMNDIPVHGITIGEHYRGGLLKRIEYWKNFGNSNLFTYSFGHLMESPPEPESYDVILLQDVLHHLEPLQDALQVLHRSLRPEGRLIINEANGCNLYHRIKLYLKRGNNRIIEQYDEILKKTIIAGNENFRTQDEWKEELEKQNFEIESDFQFIKFLPPFFYNGRNTEEIIRLEQIISNKSKLLKEYLYFGLNFTASKSVNNKMIEKDNQTRMFQSNNV